MDFGGLPPEINSGRMYCGPGAATFTEAATAWSRLAALLRDAVAKFHSVTRQPARQRAAESYLTWLDTTAGQAEQAASQASTVASAYQSAFTAMVPPPMIAANRRQPRPLARANCLGQSSEAIADVDAEYERMWSQDADAMYAYARASTDAARMTPFSSPPRAAATATPELVSSGRQVMSVIPEALQELSESPLASLIAPLAPVASSLSKLSSLSAPSDVAISHLNSLNKAVALAFLIPHNAVRKTFRAGLGRGSSIAGLSVPRTWITEAATGNPYSMQLDPGRPYEPMHLVRAVETPG